MICEQMDACRDNTVRENIKNEKESTLVKYEKTSSNITGSYFNAANKH